MRFESQTHPQDDHIDRITDCSTRYGQAPAVALAWDWPRDDVFLQNSVNISCQEWKILPEHDAHVPRAQKRMASYQRWLNAELIYQTLAHADPALTYNLLFAKRVGLGRCTWPECMPTPQPHLLSEEGKIKYYSSVPDVLL